MKNRSEFLSIILNKRRLGTQLNKLTEDELTLAREKFIGVVDEAIDARRDEKRRLEDVRTKVDAFLERSKEEGIDKLDLLKAMGVADSKKLQKALKLKSEELPKRKGNEGT